VGRKWLLFNDLLIVFPSFVLGKHSVSG